MDLSIYFQTVKPGKYQPKTLGDLTEIYDGEYFPEWEDFDIAVFGVLEDRGTKSNKGCDKGANVIREEFYQLYHHGKSLKICDLGNILPGASLEDTYHAVADVIQHLNKKNVFAIILGGSQDLTYANYLAYEKLEQTVNLACIDNKFNISEEGEEVDSENFLNKIILHQPSYLFNYGQIGHQTYLVSPNSLKLMDEMYFDVHRLGEIQGDVNLAEPVLRNADILSVDVSSIRFSEFSANKNAEPNGFYGEEICQLMRYAGMSDKLSSIGFYEYNAALDKSRMSVKLLGQMLWCLIDGISSRKKDYPIGTKEKYTKYRVHVEGTEHEIVFYKSDKSDRWWMDVPYPPHDRVKFERHHLVPCSYDAYLLCSESQIPDLWWKTYRKLN